MGKPLKAGGSTATRSSSRPPGSLLSGKGSTVVSTTGRWTARCTSCAARARIREATPLAAGSFRSNEKNTPQAASLHMARDVVRVTALVYNSPSESPRNYVTRNANSPRRHHARQGARRHQPDPPRRAGGWGRHRAGRREHRRRRADPLPRCLPRLPEQHDDPPARHRAQPPGEGAGSDAGDPGSVNGTTRTTQTPAGGPAGSPGDGEPAGPPAVFVATRS